MDRYWLLTSTTYGNWLPGDPRGFVSTIHDDSRAKVIHNQPLTEYDREHSRIARVCSGEPQRPANHSQ